jgi:hypothetical protein
VVPDGAWSDHPGGTGPFACTPPPPTTSPYWGNTVILIVWGDWGGWYDHVPPYLPPGLSYPNEGYQYPSTSGFSPDGNWYAYGFRVPLLVVSAYTPAGYVSGNITQGSSYQGKNQPYIHDFGSILGYIEWAFNLPPYNTSSKNTCGIAGALDPVNGCLYPFADYFAPDGPYECGLTFGNICSGNDPSYGGYPLSDFFTLSTPRSFTQITGAKYPPSCFQPANVNNSNCFPGYPSDPDNSDPDNEDSSD